MYDVIIIGAGAAGLSAAYKILQKDSTVKLVVLEARDRVGGRTLTVPLQVSGGETDMFDMGGQWVGQSQTHVMRLLEEFNIQTFPQYSSGKKLMQLGDNQIRSYTGDIPSLGSIWALIELQLFIWRVERMAKKVDILDPYNSCYAGQLDGDTVESFMRKHMSHASGRQTIEAACKTCFGTEPSNISALYFLAYANSAGGVMKLFETESHTAQELRVKGGTQQISEKLAEKIGRENVLLSEVVISIRQLEKNVEVITNTGKAFTGSRVIVTVPSNLMSKLEFSPALPPAKQFIYNNQPVGHLIKFIITYEKAFWKDAGYSGEIVSNGGNKVTDQCSTGPVSICFDATSYSGAPALVGFIAGRTGIEWNAKTTIERRNAVLNSLVEFLGSEAQNIICYEEKVWSEDAYSGGCPVAYGVPGTEFALPEIRSPLDKVYFAGTETATEWTGYISGAIQSGERAAMEVLSQIRQQLITTSDLKDTCYDSQRIPKIPHVNRLNDGSKFKLPLLLSIFACVIAIIMYYIPNYAC